MSSGIVCSAFCRFSIVIPSAAESTRAGQDDHTPIFSEPLTLSVQETGGTTVPTFADLGLPLAVVTTLADQGITTPFPIQTATLPDSLAGRDVLGRGRTGSGKTYAFLLPMVARLAASQTKRAPRDRGR